MSSEKAPDEDEKVGSLIDYFYRIGQPRLAQEINNEHFGRKINEILTETRFAELDQQLLEIRQSRFLEDQISIQSATFDKASSYNNIVLTLGYAGFFAIWNMVATELSVQVNTWVGFLLGVSLFAFVVWTLLSSVFTTRQIANRAKLLSREFETQEEFFSSLSLFDGQMRRSALAFQRWWPLVFTFTALTGLGAGAIVMFHLVKSIVGISWMDMITIVFQTIYG